MLLILQTKGAEMVEPESLPSPPAKVYVEKEHGANSPDVGVEMDELLERQRKVQERRGRLLELERLDKEEDELRELMRRAGGGWSEHAVQ